MQRKITFSPGEFYHLYNRGTDKRDIFLNDFDRERFIKLLYLCNSEEGIKIRDVPIGKTFTYDKGEQIVDIGAYCLMPNHFHILIHEKIVGGMSTFMKKLGTAYSMYFNKKHDRTGALFEGRFKAQHADNDEYLKYLFSYIHLNPVKLVDSKWKENGIADKDQAKRYLKGYKFSSYQDYIGESRKEEAILNKDAFPDYFEDIEFEKYIDFWLNFEK